MKVYSPFALTLKESQKSAASWQEDAKKMDVSDDTLRKYIEIYLARYEEIITQFFPDIAKHTPLLVNRPHITVVRMGPNGVIIAYQTDLNPGVRVMKTSDFDPPLESLNLNVILERLGAPIASFDFSIRTYDEGEANIAALRTALKDAWDYYWHSINEKQFTAISQDLLRAEHVDFDIEAQSGTVLRYDAIGEVLLSEPGGFRREEKWAFEFKLARDTRISASYLHQVEEYLNSADNVADVICLVTSGDITSIGEHIAVNNPRIRVWDKEVINRLLHIHLLVLESHFPVYAAALSAISQQPVSVAESPSQVEVFRKKLENCPTGKQHFALYEQIGTEIWEYLFSHSLGKSKKQPPTLDGTQRRDVLFKNNGTTQLFQRVYQNHGANFIIVDFKNYKDPIDGDVVYSVSKYANKALGRFIVTVSRKGADDTVLANQIRILRDDDVVVLVISDAQLLEMVERKDRGEPPEDVIDDILDELMYKF